MANEPITREEILLNAVATGEATNLEPITREEMFLAKLGGADVNTPMPITRKEQFLQKAIESGGSGGTGGGGDAPEWIKDGNTHIWITLHEGRTSPMLGVCPNGTVTVDWGDGTTPDVLTGTSTTSVKWTPNHEYASAGEYIITLTVDGEMGFYGESNSNTYTSILRHTNNADARNRSYHNSVQYVEIGKHITEISRDAFNSCYSLSSVVIPEGVTSIGNGAFRTCYSLSSVVIPEGVTSIGNSTFYSCYSLSSAVIPEGVTSIGEYAFYTCYSLSSAVIPEGVTSIGGHAFYGCSALAGIVVPKSVVNIRAQAFYNCYGVAFYDFSNHTAVPTLSNTDAFTGIPADCEIRVPAALYDEWIAATNWSTYASKIVAV